jgi:hypothetical protein
LIVFFSKSDPPKKRKGKVVILSYSLILVFDSHHHTPNARSVSLAQQTPTNLSRVMISLLPGSSFTSFTSLSSSNNANNALFKRRQQQQQQQRNGRTIKAVSFLRSHYFFTTNTNENASNNNTNNNNNDNNNRRRRKRRDALLKVVRATKEDKKSSTAKEVDEITKKWGLEAGLWKIFKSSEKNNNSSTNNNNKTGGEGEGAQQLSGSRMDMAKQLLKTYGSAYLITSISLSLVSFGVFYVLVSSGVDVAALLSIIGITATQNSEKVGTVAIAYAAHKAASPIRFPPTVALTPIVAGWMGKTGNKGEEEEEDGEGGEEK